MALHVTLEKGDRVMISGGIILEMRRTGKHCQISIEAPAEVNIETIYKDIKKQAESMARAEGKGNE